MHNDCGVHTYLCVLLSECLKKAVKTLMDKQTELDKELEVIAIKDLQLNMTERNLTETLAQLDNAQDELKQKSKGSSNKTRIKSVLYLLFMEFNLPHIVCKNMVDYRVCWINWMCITDYRLYWYTGELWRMKRFDG